MSPKTGKSVLKLGSASVFVGRGAERVAMGWRLDVNDDASERARLFRKPRRPGVERGRLKLFHYISAGGLRQLRRTAADDLAESRQHSFLVFLGVLLAVWVVFYFMPCA
jgi:hypothetical protein